MSDQPVVQTSAGQVRGVVDPTTGMRTWRGIPYGAPTGGRHRFRAPRPREPWTGEFDATHFAEPAMQGTYGWNDKVKGTEDCLTLDIVRPDTDEELPVVVYMHGGTFLTGSSHEKVLQGHRFARATDIVYVSLNFRLGVLGYLDLRSLGPDCEANPGTMDQILALEWVRDNISAFGGDPDRDPAGDHMAGGRNAAEDDMPSRLGQQRPHILDRIVQLLDQPRHAGQQDAAMFGQLHPAPRANEKIESDLVLKKLDLARQRRLGQAQAVRGAAQRPAFGHHDKRAKLLEIHACKRSGRLEHNLRTKGLRLPSRDIPWTFLP